MAEFIDDKIPKFDVMRACLQSQQRTKRPDLRGLHESPSFRGWLDEQNREIEWLTQQRRFARSIEEQYLSFPPAPPDDCMCNVSSGRVCAFCQRRVEGVRETYFYLDQVHALKRINIPNRYFVGLDLAAVKDDK